MKKWIPFLQVTAAVLLFFSLYAFSGERNRSRKVTNLEVRFEGNSENRLFITEKEVNKLLIQNNNSVTGVTKDALDLNNMEGILSRNKMVKNADVYLAIDGQLTASVTQKRPLARIVGNAPVYMDDEGGYMPLSGNYTARVPLIKGNVTDKNREELFKLIQKIDTDIFLKENVIGISLERNEFILSMRANDFKVKLGGISELDSKIKKLKAFYQKGIKDHSLDNYTWVNLKFEDQVVCTKK